MKKYIKSLVFLIILVLIGSVILSDPARAQVDKSIFKETINEIDQIQGDYDFMDYRIKWDSSDWSLLVEDSKNIVDTGFKELDNIVINLKIIDIQYILEDEENNIYSIVLKSNTNDLEDFNICNKIYNSNLISDSEEDSSSPII